jgi:hypothetical protein
MGIKKRKGIVAWESSDGEIFCLNCVKPEDEKGLKPLTAGDLEEEGIIICDDCEKQIKW